MPEESTMEEPGRRFLIPVKRTWKLWIPPVLALLYFAFALTVVASGITLGIPQQDVVLVMAGAGLFGVLLLWELLLLPRVKTRAAKREAKKAKKAARRESKAAQAAEPTQVPVDEPAGEAPAPTQNLGGGVVTGSDVELVLTPEDRGGRRVLEVSMPPKSTHRGAMYSKAFVQVDESYVLRIEDLVADAEELQQAAA